MPNCDSNTQLTTVQSARERERQISRIVDDGGLKFAVFFAAASGFLASSFSLFATNVINTSLLYVYPPGKSSLGSRASLILDEITLVHHSGCSSWVTL